MSATQTASSPAEAKFVQGLGLLDSTMLVAGSMIGSGVFIVSADIGRQVGSSGWLLLVWLVTGALTISAALSYGELAAMMPKAGGQYVYLREAYSPLWGFLYGWTLFLVIQTGTIAAVAVAFIPAAPSAATIPPAASRLAERGVHSRRRPGRRRGPTGSCMRFEPPFIRTAERAGMSGLCQRRCRPTAGVACRWRSSGW